MWQKGHSTTDLRCGVIGKLPGFSDFLRIAPAGREVLALEPWLNDGLYRARAALGPAWQGRYDAQLYHRFVFRPEEGGKTLMGVLRASSDSHRRRFPAAVFSWQETKEVDRWPFAVHFLMGSLFGHWERLLARAASVTSHEELAAITREEPALPEVPEVLEQRYQTFLEEVMVGDLSPTDEASGASLLEGVMDRLPSLENGTVPPITIQIPLEQPSFARSLELRFWLELLLLLLDCHTPTVSSFWPSPDNKAADASLLIAFREPAGYDLVGLISWPDEVRKIWRLGRASKLPRGRQRRRVILPHAMMSLLELLCSVQRGYPQTCWWNIRGARTC